MSLFNKDSEHIPTLKQFKELDSQMKTGKFWNCRRLLLKSLHDSMKIENTQQKRSQGWKARRAQTLAFLQVQAERVNQHLRFSTISQVTNKTNEVQDLTKDQNDSSN